MKVKRRTVYKQGYLSNETQPYCFFPKVELPGDGPRYLVEADIQREQYTKLKALDLIPEVSPFREQAEFHIYKVLYTHCRGVMRKLLKFDKEHYNLDSPKPTGDENSNQIPLQQTEVFPLPTIPLCESRIDDTIGIIEAVHKHMGVTPSDLADKQKVQPIRGDLLTIKVSLEICNRRWKGMKLTLVRIGYQFSFVPTH